MDKKISFSPRNIIILTFSWIMLSMILVTAWATSTENIVDAIVRLVSEPWVVSALLDAYNGFLIFFLWVCYKEIKLLKKIGWFIAIMLFGNHVIAIYMLLEVRRLDKDFSIERLLTEKKPA